MKVSRSSIEALLRPRSVAVVGASRRRRLARGVVANLQRFGFAGPIYPVHPTEEAVEGLRCFRAIADLPERPDCAVIALSPENTLRAFRAAVEAGVPAAVILGSGFAEAGDAGRRIQDEIAHLAAEAGVAVCGPNCLGLLTPGAGVTLTGYHVPGELRSGAVAGVAQSGSVFFSLAHNGRGIDFNLLVSSGNETILTAADFLDAALDDPSTRVLVAFLESIRDGEHFLEVAARARARHIPTVVLKVGRSPAGSAAVVAHSGALAGSDAIFSAVCAQEGIIRVETLDELYDTVDFLLAGRLPAGDRVAALTDSGGEKTLILDWGERLGLRFPDLAEKSKQRLRDLVAPYVPLSNPLDAWGGGNYEEIYPAALRALAADPSVDVVVLGTDLIDDTEEADLYARAVLDLHEETDKPVAVVANQATGFDRAKAARLREAGVPVLQGTEYGYRAIRHAVDFARVAGRPALPASAPAIAEAEWLRGELAGAPRIIGEYHAKRLLARCGLPVAREAFVRTREAALQAAARIGYPVALKAQGRGLEHKTEAGALRLHLDSPDALGCAWDELREGLAGRPGVRLEGMVVQEMVPPGLELLLGVARDPTFGPMVSVALGGVFVEVLADVVYARPPFDVETAVSLLRRLRAARLLDGFRGAPPRDVDAAARAIVALGRFAVAAGEQVAEVDVNPLIVLDQGQGVRAVDALIVKCGA